MWKVSVLPEKGACHKITALLSLTQQPPSSTKRKQVQRRGVICPEPHSREQNLTLEGSSPACCTAGTANSYQESGAGRQEGCTGANRLFCSVF